LNSCACHSHSLQAIYKAARVEFILWAFWMAACHGCGRYDGSALHCGLLPQAFYKSARVEFIPVGVVGAIVPWNWPFHNIINPISAAVMAGNAIVVKVRRAAVEGLNGAVASPDVLGSAVRSW
jgi:acyl-CoA reductase-like NAD-dependent aldehyde dehydrogenase